MNRAATVAALGSTDPCVHPRPSLTRAAWQSLDGSWSFARSHDLTPRPPALNEQIMVPYAPESPASGIGGMTDHRVFWYRRTVDLPAGWRGKRVWLRFNAVDWAATVWVAGHRVAEHQGGYSPFGVDVTELVADGPVEVLVRCIDDPSDMTQPRGKQDWLSAPHSIWYPRTSGIWQSVWWEAVDEVHVDSLLVTADLTTYSLDVDMRLAGVAVSHGREPGLRATVRVRHHDELLVDDEFGVVGASVRRRVYLDDPGIDDARARLLWSPERPHLLDVEITITRSGAMLDQVHAATALRTIETRDGAVLLNGRPYTLRLALDQGYWPETHLTPPDSDALRRDVELAKQLGFNGVRKHQKLEDPRFYAWADRLGLLVWVELPSAYAFDRRSIGRLTATWQAAIAQAAPHASVMAWVPFNESWGVPDLPNSAAQRALVRGLAELTRSVDPTRPVVGNDGWEMLSTDLINVHDYSSDPADLDERYGTRAAVAASLAAVQPAGRRLLLEDGGALGRPVLLSEFGGVRIEDGAPGWGYTAVPDSAAFLARYQALLTVVERAARAGALAGFCYTQLTDTFQERNGLLSMDREPKADIAALARATRGEGGG